MKKIFLFFVLWFTFLISWCLYEWVDSTQKTDTDDITSNDTQNTDNIDSLKTIEGSQNTSLNNNFEIMDGIVKKWNKVKVDYIGKLTDGTVFDTSIKSEAEKTSIYNPRRWYEPLEFIVGEWQMIKWFDNWVIGMKKWWIKEIKISPEDWYWQRNDKAVVEVDPKDLFWYYKYELKEKSIIIDYNNKLAWETLIFDITLVSNESWDMVKNWDIIKVDYVGKLKDGIVFDTSVKDVAKSSWIYSEQRSYEPLQFTVWWWQMIKWFDSWVVGMKKWETKSVTILPKDAYWERSDSMIKEINIWDKIDLWYSRPILVEIKDWKIKLDTNHELAWKELIFQVTLIDIIE